MMAFRKHVVVHLLVLVAIVAARNKGKFPFFTDCVNY